MTDGALGDGSVVWVLPLLSVAMVRTWQHRHDRRLTLPGYDRSGGVASAVEDVYNRKLGPTAGSRPTGFAGADPHRCRRAVRAAAREHPCADRPLRASRVRGGPPRRDGLHIGPANGDRFHITRLRQRTRQRTGRIRLDHDGQQRVFPGDGRPSCEARGSGGGRLH
ncbi:nSTAND1 domain-containing NTPase [Nonomuraea guangzhouensis]|uniref:Novel STAND NTPase 1 domain-containing protein n=1 Tax=Nonomuraea guangzhouensis TaxID=1291555 RepID=A0ABW4GXP2_9ACTN